jgi:hypothetical protein
MYQYRLGQIQALQVWLDSYEELSREIPLCNKNWLTAELSTSFI